MASERLVSVRLLLNPAGYQAGAAQVNRANAAMSAGIQSTAAKATASTAAMNAGLKTTGTNMAQVAGGAGLLRGGFTTPLVAAGAAVAGVAKASIDWESAWAGVTKTVDGSATQMERLEGDLRGMARELPATHTEIAGVAEAAGQLGVKVDDVANFSRTMVDLGETTNLSSEQAATSIARLTNIMGTGQDEVENLGSTLVELGNNSATTEAEILEFSTRLAAAGNIAGLSESDVLAFGATLTSVGVEAEAGGTALSKTFTSIRDAVIDGGEQLETFARVAGVSSEQFVQAFETDPARAIAMFIEGLGRLSRSGESTSRVFQDLELTDQRLMRALLSTAEAGDLLTDSIQLGSDAWDTNLALAEEAARRYDTISANLSRNFNRIKDQAIDAGGPVATFFDTLVEGTADLIEIGTADFQDIPDVIRGLDDEEDRLKQARERANLQKRFNSEIQGLQNRLPAATDASEDFAAAQAHVSATTVTATESLASYQEELQASTNPVFNLVNQLQAVDEAQTAYNEAVDEYGKKSPEARDASLGLAEAVAAAEAAALDGDLSFDAFEAKLASWVQQGVLTKAEAEAIAGEVKDLRGEAEDYQGGYDARMTASDVKKSDQEIRGLTNRAERYDRRYDANLGTHGTAKARSEIQGLLNRAAAWRGTHTATFIGNSIVSGTVGNLFAGRGHDGGMVTTAGIQRFHGGGEVTSTIPRFHQGTTRLAPDEVPAILQTGEMVLSRAQVAMMERARYLELVAREMVRLGDVTDDEWGQLLALGWQGKAGDRMEALYPPLEGVRREFIKFGEVTNTEWERLKRLGWQGKAGDRMEALYPPLESLAVEAGKAAKLLRDANLNQTGVSGKRRTWDFFRSGGKSFAHIFGTGETLALGQMGEMQAGDFLRAMGKIPKAHKGGHVLGADEGLAVLQRGEAVVSKRDMAMAAAMSSRPMPALPPAPAASGGTATGITDRQVASAVARAINGAELILIDNNRGRLVAREADLYGRAG